MFKGVNKMRIGIDIDGVLTNEDDYILECATKFCYENNLEYFNNPYNYETKKFSWNNDKNILEQYRDKYFYEYVKNEPPRKFASEIIKKLKEDGHEIFIITGRYKSHDNNGEGRQMRTQIKEWLNKNEIVYDKLIFAKVPKIKELKENKIDIMIEDSPSTIPLINDIVKVFCFDNRYNRNLECTNMTRVFSWYDIYMRIKNIKQS